MKNTVIIIIILGIIGAYWWFTQPTRDHIDELIPVTNSEAKILYYTCSMHPAVRVSPEEYKKGQKNCPICSMPLVSVKEEAPDSSETDSTSLLKKETMVKLNATETMLANVQTVEAKIQPVFKEIRTVGQVAYDPKLLVAQEEFVAALKAHQKLEQAPADVVERSDTLLEATRRKLRLQGMSANQITSLERTRKLDTNLLLPESSAWVYADIYEQDSALVKPGQTVMIETESAPDQMLTGTIKALDPILKEKTRTLRARILIQNANNELQPNAYVDVYIKVSMGNLLVIPKTAVLDTGARKIVYIASGKSYIQQKITTGPEAIVYHGEHKTKVVPVYSGLNPGQLIVDKANFLIDSQSQIGAAASAFGGALGDKETPMPAGHQH